MVLVKVVGMGHTIAKRDAPHANRYWRRKISKELRDEATIRRRQQRVHLARVVRNIEAQAKRERENATNN